MMRLLVILLLVWQPALALPAQPPPGPIVPAGVEENYPCAWLLAPSFCIEAKDTGYCYPNRDTQPPPPLSSTAPGVVSLIIEEVSNQIGSLGKQLYEGIVNDAGFQATVKVVLMLYIIFYGIMIWFNMASYSTMEIIRRAVKLGIVITITSTGTWGFFMSDFGNFFIDGMNSLIQFFNTQGYDNGLIVYGSYKAPLANLDLVVSSIFSQHFLLMMAALIFTGPFGWVHFIFLLVGLVFFFLAVIGAVVTYVRSLVGIYFLFGIAPIFIVFSLFGRTKELFMSWVNHIVSFALQPVLVFAFFSFFVGVMGSSADRILLKDIVHDGEMKGGTLRPYPDNIRDGEPFCYAPLLYFDRLRVFSFKWFRPAAVDDGVLDPITDNRVPWLYTGDVDTNGPSSYSTLDSKDVRAYFPNRQPLPINTSEMFLFILWGFLAWRYLAFIKDMVSTLTEGGLNIEATLKNIGGWFKPYF